MKHIGRCPYMINDDLANIYEETILQEFAPGFQGQQRQQPLSQQRQQPATQQPQQQPQQQRQQQQPQRGQAVVQQPQVNPQEQLNSTFDAFVKQLKDQGYVQNDQDAQYWQQVKKYLSTKMPNTTNQKQIKPSNTTQLNNGFENELKAALGAG